MGGGGGGPADDTVRQLQAEVAELRAVKLRRDAQFDQLAAVVEQRTDQFKRLIGQRHSQIEALQSQLRRATSKASIQHRAPIADGQLTVHNSRLTQCHVSYRIPTLGSM